MKRGWPLTLIFALINGAAPPVWAVETITSQIGTAHSDKSQIESSDRINAQQWGLSLEEWRRYQFLMKGIRGSVSDPHITPIEVLGIHASSETERRKYAERFAQIMAEDTDRVLKFEIAYQQAFRRLYPNLAVIESRQPGEGRPTLQQVLAAAPLASPAGVIDRHLFPTRPVDPTVRPMKASFGQPLAQGDRLILFISPKCADCKRVLNQAHSIARDGIPVDLHVLNVKSDAELVAYARRVRIDPQLASNGRITLNLDQGTMARVLPGEKRLPQAIRKRGDALMRISLME